MMHENEIIERHLALRKEEGMELSIIMPCYNVESTIDRALNSIQMQQVNFGYEIIIVNDGSADNSLRLMRAWQKRNNHVVILDNEKNLGNAESFYRGVCAAKGKYFCVLDGDDYYTVPDKLQRQVDFLNNDVEEEYVATATRYIVDLGNGEVYVPPRRNGKEFGYTDMLAQNLYYFHTATYMYRNIYMGNVPLYFKMSLYRGDTPRTLFALRYSKKKVRILDFIGSAYTFEHKGIWSKMKARQQDEYQVNFQTQHRQNVDSDFERSICDRRIKYYSERALTASTDVRKYPSLKIENAVSKVREYASIFAFKSKDYVFHNSYYSDYLDSLCASLGYIYRLYHQQMIQKRVNADHIVIVIGVLNPRGGGIFSEISELIDIYQDKQVYIFVTNMAELSQEVRDVVLQHPNAHLCFPPNDVDKLSYFAEQLVEIEPCRAYYYCSHNDACGQVIMQKGVCENIAFYSFDHGCCLGISNPNLDWVIAKRPVDYAMLKKKFGARVLFIPTWNHPPCDCEKLEYEPFYRHDKLITATGAARYYKLSGRKPYRYADIIVDLLKKTGGVHYHFGAIPQEEQEEIKRLLVENGVSPRAFINIEWSENLPKDLLSRHVDIFIEPFPVVSYKLTLDAISVKIPVIRFNGITRMQIADFLPEDCLSWSHPDELIAILSSLTKRQLQALSNSAYRYYMQYHSDTVVKELIRKNQGCSVNTILSCADNLLLDITDSFDLFGSNHVIDVIQDNKQKKVTSTVTPKVTPTVTPKVTSNRDNIADNNIDYHKILCQLRASYSYRLGYTLAWFPRMFLTFFRFSSRHGIRKALHLMKTTDCLSMTRETDYATIMAIKRSRTYRLEQMCVMPMRWVYTLWKKNFIERGGK